MNEIKLENIFKLISDAVEFHINIEAMYPDTQNKEPFNGKPLYCQEDATIMNRHKKRQVMVQIVKGMLKKIKKKSVEELIDSDFEKCQQYIDTFF